MRDLLVLSDKGFTLFDLLCKLTELGLKLRLKLFRLGLQFFAAQSRNVYSKLTELFHGFFELALGDARISDELVPLTGESLGSGL